MATYFISPQRKTGLHISVNAFRDGLLRRWPSARVAAITNPKRGYVLEFNLETDAGYVNGMLDRDGDAVVLDGDLTASAEVASWVSGIIDPVFEVVFYDEGYTSVASLSDRPSPEEIIRRFGKEGGV